MPLQKGKDKGKSFFRWGSQGKKYFYKPDSVRSKSVAMDKAVLQGKAIHANKNRS